MSFINFLGLSDETYGDYAKGILYVICEIINKLIKGIGTLIDVITGLFYKIAGSTYLGSGSEVLVEEQDLFSKLFNQNIVSDLSLFMIVISISLMALFGTAAVVKQLYFSKDDRKSLTDVIKNMILGFIFLVVLTPLAMLAISSISALMPLIIGMFGDNSNVSLSDLLFNASFSGNAIEAYNAMYEAEITTWKEIDNNFIFDIFYGTNTTGITFYWYAYFLGATVVLYNLVLMTFRVVKRIFNVIILYVTGPIYVARMVDDGGFKFKEWKNKALGELMSIVGTVVAFMLLISLVGVINEVELVSVAVNGSSILDTGIRALAEENTVNETALLTNNLTKMFLIMAGTSVAKDSGELFGNIFKSTDENGTLLEGIFNRLGTKESSVTTKSESSAPRTRVITRNTTTTRKIIDYTESVPSSRSEHGSLGGGNNINNHAHNTINTTVNNVDRHITNIQNRSNVNVKGESSTGAKTGNYKAGSQAPTKVLDRGFANYVRENDKIRNEWDMMKGENSASSREVVKEFESASKELESSIGTGEQSKIRNSMNRYVEAYKAEEKIAKEGYRDFAGKSAKLGNDLSFKQQSELKKISAAYQKAQVDYTKTARKLGEVSSGNMSTSDALRLKENADKQREKLMEASSRANDFYNQQKKGD